MRIKLAVLILFASFATGRADDKIASVQQALKDQGFYYGEITGEKNADLTASIRRFQIRNGLEITGELNDETLRSLRSAPAAASPTPSQPVVKSTPPPPPDTSDLRDGPVYEEEDGTIAPRPPVGAPPGERLPPEMDPGPGVMPRGGTFAGTPYQTAPIDVQRRVIGDAQRVLARRGLYKGEINGMFGPNLEFSLRAYQTRVGLQPTGRLDLDTLAALKLLPGADAPVFTPRRVLRPRPGFEPPPVRGEWIRP